MLSYQEIKELMETQTNDMISEDYVLIGEISILFEAKIVTRILYHID